MQTMQVLNKTMQNNRLYPP